MGGIALSWTTAETPDSMALSEGSALVSPSSFVRACLSAVSSDEGLSAAAAATLSNATRNDSVGLLACANGSLCIVLLPASSSAPAKDGAPAPSPYDLPSAASLPCLFIADAHTDCIWAIAQAPPGYPVTCAEPDALTALPAKANTRSVPLFLSAGADGLLRLWRLGIRTDDGRPGVSLLASLDVSAHSREAASITVALLE